MLRALLLLACALAGAHAFVKPSARLVRMRRFSSVDRPTPSLVISRVLSPADAVAEFKMITEDEATVRKLGGVVIGVATAVAFATTGLAYGTLSGGIFGAISTYRTGAEYQ